MTAFAACHTWAARWFLARTRPNEPLPPPCGCDPACCPPITTKEPTR